MDLYQGSLGSHAQTEEDEGPMVLDLEQYEELKKAYQVVIERAECARRLAENPDFQKLVMEGYLQDEPKRLAELMASGRLHQTNLENCTRELDAIGKFRTYLSNIIQQGNISEDDLKALEEERERALQEDAGE